MRFWCWLVNRPAWAICIALMVVGAAYRVCLLATTFTRLDSDQAITGLMAFHIQAGDRPVFYYGQPYQGSAEAYGAAFFFNLFGANAWTVRLPTLLFSIAFVGGVYWLGRTLYGPRIAFLAALFVALGPSILISSSTASGFGYIEVMVCGVALLLLALRYPDLRAMPVLAALACGMLIGFGLWTQPMMAEYVLPVAIAFSARLLFRQGDQARAGRPALARSLIAILLGTMIGGAPLLVYNLQHHWETIAYLRARTPGGNHLTVAGHLVSEALPVLTGLVTPTTVPTTFAHLVASQSLHYIAALACGLGIVAWLVLGPRGLLRRIACLFPLAAHYSASPEPRDQPCRRRDAPCDGILALFVLSCLLFFVGTGFAAARAATLMPRYLTPLYTATPLVLDSLIPTRSNRRTCVLAPLAVGLLLLFSVLTTVTASLPRASVTAVAGAALSPPPIDGLTHLLEAHQVHVAYASYWLANRISFETDERVLGVPVRAGRQLNQVRMPGYLAVAARLPAGRIAWIFTAGTRDDRAFLELLRHRHIDATRLRWDELVVYTGFSRRP